uniref:Acyl-coenzyme A synthetase/AMP-(Fatty) acidligase n=1 Tax=Staphylococcus aureus TaxID=1280 RepID=A0A811APZ0_STAAU|nr:acyl-coenzyme A synthetase/AMP-(fatty) acidligase [Staphylococcus aureus]BDX51513.1 acyl-coenzyme A synthetase/AMP-(fatty)acidligase [Staphylococcus aureus]
MGFQNLYFFGNFSFLRFEDSHSETLLIKVSIYSETNSMRIEIILFDVLTSHTKCMFFRIQHHNCIRINIYF